MTSGTRQLQYRQLRAPREDRTAVIIPGPDQVAGVAAANQAQRSRYVYDFQGRSIGELTRQARQELAALARHWTSSYRDADSGPLSASATIFLAGHQPQLFHPGVWFKNFALDRLARQHAAVAINLVVDNDTLKTNALLVPGGSTTEPNLAAIPLDRSDSPLPFEERRIEDRGLLRSFGRRVAGRIAPLVPDPLVRQYWPMVVQRMCKTDNLGACLAQARHQLEGQWGAATWEVPVSWLCQTESFAWFIAHVLAHLPRFREIYNGALHEYRQLNRVRSTAHPAPDLAVEGDWIEAPFWIWSDEDPWRRRLFARRRADAIEIADRHGQAVELPMRPDGDATRAVGRLMELSNRGVKIRSRAMITTLWARLVLGDLFLHGIGGAKYDQVTDAIMSRFFGLQPPGFLVVSATLLLPAPHRKTTLEDLHVVDRELRELTFHPELYAEGNGQAHALSAEKQRWIRTEPNAENFRQRFLEIRRINAALQPFVAADRARLLDERQRVQQALHAEGILSSREYAFCLHSEESLREAFALLLPSRHGRSA
jgi:hypothetical protein